MKPLLRSGDWRVSFSLMANMAVTKARWKPVTGTRLASSRLKNGALTWTDLQTWLRGLKRPGLRQRGAQSVQLRLWFYVEFTIARLLFLFFFMSVSLWQPYFLIRGGMFFSFFPHFPEQLKVSQTLQPHLTSLHFTATFCHHLCAGVCSESRP